MNGKILYAGDTTLTTAASYLAGVLTYFALEFDYLASNQPIGESLSGAEHALYILSDYPVNNFQTRDWPLLLDRVAAGAGLLMIGGWESFHGAAGEYHDSPLADVLPVAISDRDDRVNAAQLCLLEKLREHPILGDLPLDRPPGIGGYNRIAVKPGATTILACRHFAVTAECGQYRFTPREADPILVLGSYGRGRTAALATDVAPHWVGGLVDWGPQRVKAQASGAEAIEVGSHYAALVGNIVKWMSRKI